MAKKLVDLKGKPLKMGDDLLEQAAKACSEHNVQPHIVIGLQDKTGYPIVMSNLDRDGEKRLIEIIHNQQIQALNG